MARILVTESIADKGLDVLRAAGHTVDIAEGKTPEEIHELIKGAHALIIRSATFVDEAMLNAADVLCVVGRAGIGLDNVDIVAATQKGVMVVNAPTSNVISAAEQAMALIMSTARNTPQAHSALKGGKWERSKWEGVELYGKTVGIVGLGRIGALVAKRCEGFGMKVVAFDPFISQDRAGELGVTLLSLEELMGQADFISVHLPKTKETTGIINEKMFALAKPELRIVNTSRGGIVDETALYDAIVAGKIAGAGLDVFVKEPLSPDSPLLTLDSVVVAPHLGASTREAQDKAGDTIAEMVQLALAGEFVPFAVNVDAGEASETVRPYLALAERLGRVIGGLCDAPCAIEIEYAGEIAGYDTRILGLAVQKGYVSAFSDQAVTYVNAPALIATLGAKVSDSKTTFSQDYRSKITIKTVGASDAGHSVAGTVAGLAQEPRLVMVDDHQVEVPPSSNLLIIRNEDCPGIIGAVGTILASHNVNISNMGLGQGSDGRSALMVLDTQGPVPLEAISELADHEGISAVTSIQEA